MVNVLCMNISSATDHDCAVCAQVLFLRAISWRCNSCFVSPSLALLSLPSCVCSTGGCGVYAHVDMFAHSSREDDTGEAERLWWIPTVSYMPDVKCFSVCQCCQWALVGVVAMIGWAAEAHSRCYCSHSPCPTSTPYNFRGLMGLEQVNWIWRKRYNKPIRVGRRW